MLEHLELLVGLFRDLRMLQNQQVRRVNIRILFTAKGPSMESNNLGGCEVR